MHALDILRNTSEVRKQAAPRCSGAYPRPGPMNIHLSGRLRKKSACRGAFLRIFVPFGWIPPPESSRILLPTTVPKFPPQFRSFRFIRIRAAALTPYFYGCAPGVPGRLGVQERPRAESSSQRSGRVYCQKLATETFFPFLGTLLYLVELLRWSVSH